MFATYEQVASGCVCVSLCDCHHNQPQHSDYCLSASFFDRIIVLLTLDVVGRHRISVNRNKSLLRIIEPPTATSMRCVMFTRDHLILFIYLFSLTLSELADRLKCAGGCERGKDVSTFILICSILTLLCLIFILPSIRIPFIESSWLLASWAAVCAPHPLRLA